jgi:DNA-binding FrmR family transcriptional regulator
MGMSSGPGRDAEEPGYADGKDELVKRLRRIEGQVGGIQKMIEGNRYCIDVVTQISAVEAALDQVALMLLADHTRHCVIEAKGEKRSERFDELLAVVGRLLGARR